jgi:hypothetical protein
VAMWRVSTGLMTKEKGYQEPRPERANNAIGLGFGKVRLADLGSASL